MRWIRLALCLFGLLIPLVVLAQSIDTSPTLVSVANAPLYNIVGTPASDENMGEVYGVIWSPDGTRILSTSQDGGVRIWDVDTGERLQIFPGHLDGRVRGEWSPDGTRVVTASADNTAGVWDANTGELLFTLSGHSAPVWAANWSPDGSRIVTSGEDQTAVIWDAHDGQALFTLSGHFDTVRGARWSPDGLRIATASDDGIAMIWDATTGENLFTLIGHDQTQYLEMAQDSVSVISAIWSPDGSRLVTSGTDDQGIVWDMATGEIVFQLPMDSPYVILGQWSPDGSRVLLITLDGSIKMWSMDYGTEVFTLVGHTDFNTWGEWSPDGTRLLTSNFDGTARVWDADTGEPLLSLFHNASVYNAAWSPDGERIATAGLDGTIRLWDATTGAELPFLFPPATEQAPQVTPVGAAMNMTLAVEMTQIVPTLIANIAFENAGAAQIGENAGELELLGGQSWRYNGRSGEQLTIQVIAELDAAVRILNPDGTLLAATEFMVPIMNPRLDNVVLSVDGEYQIDVTSVIGSEEGVYTLIIEVAE